MSINYHAYQNIGYLFSHFEALSEQWYERYTGYDPAREAGILSLPYDEEYLYITYLDVPFRLRRKDGRFEKQLVGAYIHADPEKMSKTLKQKQDSPSNAQDGEWTEEVLFNEAIVLYHLLYYVKDTPREAGKWVQSYALDGVVSRNPNVKDPLLDPFAIRFSGKCREFIRCCELLGGTKGSQGDASYEFAALPGINVRLIFWDKDEDFPAQLQYMVRDNITDYLHYETTGCILSDILEKIYAIADIKQE